MIINLLWRFLERFAAQGISFLVSIILARLVTPQIYGTIALVTTFIAILQVFVDSGFGNSLIQKLDADDLDFSTVFFFNIIFCILLYILVYYFAPLISIIFGNSQLVQITRVLAINLIFFGIRNIQFAYISRNLLFKRFFYSTLSGTFISGLVSIWMVYTGFGIWALVTQQILNASISTVVLWITVKWRPKFQFSFKRLKTLFKYGWKILVSGLLDTIYNEISQLIIGKNYSTEILAFYNKGKQLPSYIVLNINSTIKSVLLPLMSQEQLNIVKIKDIARKSLISSTYIMTPIIIGMFVLADKAIILLLTEKWLPCVFYVKIFSLSFVFHPLVTTNQRVLKALGRSDMFLKIEVFKKIIGLACIFIATWFSVEAIAYAFLATSVLGQILNTIQMDKLIDYGFFKQLKDIIPNIIISIIMGIIVYILGYLKMQIFILLVIQILSGVVVYIGLSAAFSIEFFHMIKGSLLYALKGNIH